MNFSSLVRSATHVLALLFVLALTKRALGDSVLEEDMAKVRDDLVGRVRKLRDIVGSDESKMVSYLLMYDKTPSVALRTVIMNTISAWFHRCSDDALETYRYLSDLQSRLDAWTISKLQDYRNFFPRHFDGVRDMFV